MLRPFHLALPTTDLTTTRQFYTAILGCTVGREDLSWIDLDFFGHQLVFHDCGGEGLPTLYNPVDQHQVPLPHFGVILKPGQFSSLATKLAGTGSIYYRANNAF